MRNVNARQPGLVSFLDLFTDGRAPDILGQQIQAGIDITQFVNLAKREPVYTSEAGRIVLGGLFINQLVVPPNEAWLVLEWAIESSLAVNLIAVAPSIYRGAPFPGHRTCGSMSTNNGSGYATCFMDRVQLLRPGDQLSGHFSSNPLGSVVDFFGFGEIVRIRL